MPGPLPGRAPLRVLHRGEEGQHRRLERALHDEQVLAEVRGEGQLVEGGKQQEDIGSEGVSLMKDSGEDGMH